MSELDGARELLKVQGWVHNDLDLRGTPKEKWRKQGDKIEALRNWHTLDAAMHYQTRINQGQDPF